MAHVPTYRDCGQNAVPFVPPLHVKVPLSSIKAQVHYISILDLSWTTRARDNLRELLELPSKFGRAALALPQTIGPSRLKGVLAIARTQRVLQWQPRPP